MLLRHLRIAAVSLIVALTISLGAVSSSFAGPDLTPLVSTQWLKDNLGAADLVIIDIRGKTEDAVYGQDHIPGAVWSAYPGGWRGDGKVPGAVPSAADLEAQIAGLGISADTSVVIMPAGTGHTEFAGAARIYWSLRFAGHQQVAILDGGWQAWLADPDNPIDDTLVEPVKSGFVADIQSRFLATTPAVSASINSDAILIDSRATAHFTGETKSAAVSRAGHLSGAISLDNALFYEAGDNRIKTISELAALMPTSLNDKDADVITYCNGGHWSSTTWFVMHELLGYKNVALYADSMVGWTQDPDNAVEK